MGKDKGKTPTTDDGDETTDNRPVPKSPLTELWDRRGTRDADYKSGYKERKKHEKDSEDE